MDILIYGDIPNGSGLSSSASLEVLTGLMLKDTFGFDTLTMTDLALIGQYSENNFNGMNCGIMDQFASAMGKKDNAIFLDTATLNYTYAPVKLTDARIVITNSKVKHSLVSSAYNDRRRECETALAMLQKVVDIQTLGDLTEAQFEQYKDAITDPVCQKRAKHAVYENQRTIRAVEALQQGDLEEFGRLINASHVSLRDDYETSCAETDLLASLAWKIPGVLGSRITGGGFGGCTVSIVKNDAIDTFIGEIGPVYEKETGHKNRAIINLMKANGIIDGDVEPHLDLYFTICSLSANCRDMAFFAAVLANNGVNPNTKEQLIPLRVVKLVRTLMVTCGMYDYSGEYAATVGMPSKSGVGGGIIAAPIGKCGIAAYGPALDEKGNSVGGLKIMEFLSEKMDLHMF